MDLSNIYRNPLIKYNNVTHWGNIPSNEGEYVLRKAAGNMVKRLTGPMLKRARQMIKDTELPEE